MFVNAPKTLCRYLIVFNIITIILVCILIKFHNSNNLTIYPEKIIRNPNVFQKICKNDVLIRAEINDSLKLDGLIIIMRNGIRASLTHFRVSNKIFCSNIKTSNLFQDFYNYMNNKSFLRLNIHRFQNDFHDFTVFPNFKRCELGQLTMQGLEQILQNGLILAKHYRKLIQYLEHYHIEIFSTKSYRTLQSSIAFLFAFLPRNLFEKVLYKIQDIPSPNVCFDDCICNKIYALKPKNIRNKLLDQINKIVNENDQDTYELKTLHDLLLSYYCHDKNEFGPCQPQYGCITNQHFLQMFHQADNNLLFKYSKQYCSLRTYGFIKKFLEHMIKIIQKQNSVTKLFLYSVHEESIRCLVLLISNHNSYVPFGSQIIFELFSQLTSFVRFKKQIHFNEKKK